MRLSALLAASLLALCACATPTPYGPSSPSRTEGFSEQKIEANRYLVTVRGNFVTTRERVEQMLLYRAAELTLANGYDHFVLTGRKTDSKSRLDAFGGSNFGFGLSWYSPRWGWRWWDDPIWADPPSYREVTRFEASAEAAMFKGPKPATDANAYDARAVQENLASVTLPPQKP